MIGMTCRDLFSNCDDVAFFYISSQSSAGKRKRLIRLWECKDLSDFFSPPENTHMQSFVIVHSAVALSLTEWR